MKDTFALLASRGICECDKKRWNKEEHMTDPLVLVYDRHGSQIWIRESKVKK